MDEAFRNLAVLIVSWNQAERLAQCLESVLRFLPGARVIVVDNGSDVPVSAPGVTVLRSPVNLGYAGGNNLGWVRARESEYVLLLNNDTRLPSAEPIRTLRAFLESHPACAAAQASLQLPDGTMDACGELLTRPFGVLYHRGYRQAPGAEASEGRPVFAGKGACLLLRSEAVEEVGGVLFRPEFFCYYEDIDLCHRLWLAGREVWYVPTEPVLHEERSTARRLPARQVWRHYLSNMLTSAFDLWGWRAWLTLGVGFLGAVVAGAVVKGVVPRPKRSRVRFARRAREGEFLPRVTVCPAPSYYWKVFKGLIAR